MINPLITLLKLLATKYDDNDNKVAYTIQDKQLMVSIPYKNITHRFFIEQSDEYKLPDILFQDIVKHIELTHRI